MLPAGASPPLDTLTGLVLHNGLPFAGGFACSDEVLTQFARNDRWTQRANFLEVPTDCPQLDERLEFLGLPKGALGMLARLGMPSRVTLELGDA